MAAKKKDAEPEEANDEDGKPEGEGAEGVDLPKKKIAGKKLVLLIVVALLLLLGGGGAALYFTGMIGGHGEETVTAEGEHGDSAHGEEGESASHGPIYFEMPSIVVNLTSTGRRPVYAKVKVSFVLGKESDRAILTENQPRIIDSFQTYLRELSPEEIQGSAGLIRLREELLIRVNAAVAPAVVKDILFQEILPQ